MKLCRTRRTNKVEHGQGFEEVSQEALVGTVTGAMAASDPSRRCRFVLEECVLRLEPFQKNTTKIFPKIFYWRLLKKIPKNMYKKLIRIFLKEFISLGEL